MDSSINMIDDVQNHINNRDCNLDNIGELNKCMALEKEVILNVNIRGLNANFNNLLVSINPLSPCGTRFFTFFRLHKINENVLRNCWNNRQPVSNILTDQTIRAWNAARVFVTDTGRGERCRALTSEP